ncbi:MAG TPA: tetratricopeptide repeat protein [Rubricoccaceae bacterium]|jgi:tetratricopeptide (TPR) repeat protein
MARPRTPAHGPSRRDEAPAAVRPAAAEPAAPLSAGTRRAFWAATLLLPVLFFALLEGGLRLGGYGGAYPLFVPLDASGAVLTPNREVARRYFAVGSFVPNPNPDFFSAVKPADGLRVVVQGESSTAGYPYYRGASFPQVLGSLLRRAYPDRTVEVVNTAMAAVNSYTLLDMADEVVAARPDVVVIYTGHNEFYGALGAASAEALGGSPAVVRAYLGLRRFRTVQLFRNGLAWVQRQTAAAPPTAGDGRPSTTLMAQMVGEQSVPLGSETYRRGVRQFEENLDLLLARYAAAGIPVYVGTLASNERDQRPFVVATREGGPTEAARAERIAAAVEEVRAGRATAGVAALRALAADDTLAADAPFALGRALLATGDRAGAAVQLRRARDLDALRFRAPTAFNGVIRRVAARHGAHVVETEERLQRASPDGVVGYRLMLEHLHPNLDGYALLADAFFEALRADRLAGPAARPTPPGRRLTLITPADSLAAYMRMDKLTRSWPYRPDEVLAVDVTAVPPYVAQQAEAILNGADWLATTSALAGWYAGQGDAPHARQAYRAAAHAYPFLAGVYVGWANFELAQATTGGQPARLPAAVRLYERALAVDPAEAQASMMLGAMRLQAGDAPGAVRYLEQATRGAAAPPQALYNLAGAYAGLGRWADAERVATRLAGANPGNAAYQQFAEAVRRRTLNVE